MSWLPVFILPFCIVLNLKAELFQGFVIDSLYSSPIPGVEVKLENASTVTDSNGYFSLETNPTGILIENAFSSSNPEILIENNGWKIRWNDKVENISVRVRDVSGEIHWQYISTNGGQTYLDLQLSDPGIFFVELVAGAYQKNWVLRNFPGATNPVYENGRKGKEVISLSKLTASTAKTLVFQKQGYEKQEIMVSSSQTNMQVSMPQKPIKALIVDGKSNHHWKQTTKVTQAILQNSGLFEVDVFTAPGSENDKNWETWSPPFSDYEVVIQNYNGGHKTSSLHWPERVQKLLEDYVAKGGGLFILHSANNSFPNWVEYNKMIGVGWRSIDFGYALEITSEGDVIKIPPGEGGGTGHGARNDAMVHLLTRHPMFHDYPDKWMASTLEIYTYARGPAENVKVLTYAHDQRNFPIEILVDYGKGQVFNTSMGHVWGSSTPDAVKDVSFQTNLIRASEWLARRHVIFPLPADFPGENEVSLREIPMD